MPQPSTLAEAALYADDLSEAHMIDLVSEECDLSGHPGRMPRDIPDRLVETLRGGVEGRS
jgi:hypothetical protein